MSIFKSLFDLGKDVVDIVAAPVEVAIDMTRVVTKPVADLSKEVVNEVKATTEEITEESP